MELEFHLLLSSIIFASSLSNLVSFLKLEEGIEVLDYFSENQKSLL